MIGSRGWITKVLLDVLSFTKVIFELDLETLKENRVHQIEKNEGHYTKKAQLICLRSLKEASYFMTD